MLFLAAGLLAGLSLAPPQEPETPDRLALFIGITEYPEIEEYREFPPLTGCLNDIELLSQALIERFEFVGVGTDMQIILNEEATHKNVVIAIHNLILQAGPNTEVLIYFSGHGSRLPDTSGQTAVEIDGKDSTFVVFDSRSPELESPFDLTDDELFSLVQALCSKTQNVTLITDCCHSGGVVRGNPKQAPRLAPEAKVPFDPATVESFWPSEIPFLEDGDLRRKQGLPFVHLAACASDEIAREITFEDVGLTYGVLTYYLVEELRNLEPGTTFAQLASKLKVRVASEVWGQSVQIEGAVDRIIFGGKFAEPLPGFEALAEMSEEGYIEIEAGQLHLLNEDTVFEIHSLQGQPLGTATMWELDALSSTAQWVGTPIRIKGEEDQDVEPISLPVRAIPNQSWQTETLDVVIDEGDAGNRFQERLRPLCGEEVVLTRQPTATTSCKITAVKIADAVVWQLTSFSDGALLWQAPIPCSSEDLTALSSVFKREQLFRSLMSLSKSHGGIPLEIQMAPATTSTLEGLRSAWPSLIFSAAVSRDLPSGLSNSESSFERLLDRDGPDLSDVAEIHISLPDEKRPLGAYISVLCLSSDRTISTIYPTDMARQNYLEPGESLSIPVEVFFNPGANPELGVRDRYFAIATASWVDFSIFQRTLPVHEAAEQATNVKTKRSGSTNSKMPPIMQQALDGNTLRGSGQITSGAWNFGISALDIQIFQPDKKQ